MPVPSSFLLTSSKLTAAKGLAVLMWKLMRLPLSHHDRRANRVLVVCASARIPNMMRVHDSRKFILKLRQPTVIARQVCIPVYHTQYQNEDTTFTPSTSSRAGRSSYQTSLLCMYECRHFSSHEHDVCQCAQSARSVCASHWDRSSITIKHSQILVSFIESAFIVANSTINYFTAISP